MKSLILSGWLLLKTVITVLTIFIIASCSKLISDEFPDFNEIPTINSIIVAGEPIKIHVSLAEKIDSSYLTLVNTAVVILTSNQAETDTLSLIDDGLYISDIVARHGHTYYFEVIIEGFDSIFGSDSVMMSEVEARIFFHTHQYRYNEEGQFMEGIGIEFRDNPNTVDYYEIALIQSKNANNNHLVSPYNENSKIILNEGFEPYSTPTLLFTDQLISDSVVRLYLDFYKSGHGKWCITNDSCFHRFGGYTMKLEFRHVSESYYHYMKSYYFYEKARYPGFIEGTATTYPLYTNVENGYGIIASYAYTIDSLNVPLEYVPVK